MKKPRIENRDVEDLEPNYSPAKEVFPSDAFDDFIQEEARLKDSEALIPRETAPKPTLTLTLDKNSLLTSQQLQNPQGRNPEADPRRPQKEAPRQAPAPPPEGAKPEADQRPTLSRL